MATIVKGKYLSSDVLQRRQEQRRNKQEKTFKLQKKVKMSRWILLYTLVISSNTNIS